MFIQRQESPLRLTLQQQQEEIDAAVELSSINQKHRYQKLSIENVKRDFPCANTVFIKDWLQQGRSVKWIKAALQSQEEIFEKKKKPQQRILRNDGSQVDHVSKYITFDTVGCNSTLPPPPPPPHNYLRRESSIMTDDGSISFASRMLLDADSTSQISRVKRSTIEKKDSKTSDSRPASNPKRRVLLKAQGLRDIFLSTLSRRDQNIPQDNELNPSSGPESGFRPNLSRRDQNIAPSKLPPSLSNLKLNSKSIEPISNNDPKNGKCALGNNEMGIILCLFPKADPRHVLNLLRCGRSLQNIIIILG
eukprot:CAMPEP_0194213496 /NCGR_PEP_ID=MMETSP0156-20130528/14149_1 /TAXON_ID=33649 /ORGANISM="Thalassionema nitzschioides, Strain L26-B" /LENGTH=305 /DNA_ID=CAMNT_0038941543 /DNA_START=63 /DNA_END=977 /DNA_ORIENTATION=+